MGLLDCDRQVGPAPDGTPRARRPRTNSGAGTSLRDAFPTAKTVVPRTYVRCVTTTAEVPGAPWPRVDVFYVGGRHGEPDTASEECLAAELQGLQRRRARD